MSSHLLFMEVEVLEIRTTDTKEQLYTSKNNF